MLNIVVELYANYDQDETDNGVEAHWEDFNELVITYSFDIENVYFETRSLFSDLSSDLSLGLHPFKLFLMD